MSPGTEAPPSAPPHRGKRTYVAPRIVSREPLEAIAGACTPATEGGTGKADPTCGTPGS